jgi:hypothetical protein
MSIAAWGKRWFKYGLLSTISVTLGGCMVFSTSAMGAASPSDGQSVALTQGDCVPSQPVAELQALKP